MNTLQTYSILNNSVKIFLFKYTLIIVSFISYLVMIMKHHETSVLRFINPYTYIRYVNNRFIRFNVFMQQQFHAWYWIRVQNGIEELPELGRQHAWKFANNGFKFTSYIQKCASNLAHSGKIAWPKPFIFHFWQEKCKTLPIICLTPFCAARTNWSWSCW